MPNHRGKRKPFILILGFILLIFPTAALAQTAVDLSVHYIEAQPAEDNLSFIVRVFVSVLDSAGEPIRELTAANFTVTEDSRKVAISEVNQVTEEPISLVLLIDTSGSMGGSKITAARTAAANFIAELGENDQVAVVAFNETATTVRTFSDDNQNISSQIEIIEAERNAGTCLYDTAYEAAILASTQEAGRRAVLILTDGVDEVLGGGACSSLTEDDVIDLATDPSTSTPIYTLGLGEDVDKQALTRIAELTGGRYLFAPDEDELESLFAQLAGQLNSQYVISYTSTQAPGPHTVVVDVDVQGDTAQDRRSFLLPSLETQISIETPLEGQEVEGGVLIRADAPRLSAPISRVVLEINGSPEDEATSFPYEFTWDFSTAEIRSQTITVIAYGQNDEELARESVSVVVVGLTAEDVPEDPETNPQDETESGGNLFSSFSFVPYLVGGAILILILVVSVFFVFRRRRTHREEDADEWGTMELEYRGRTGVSDNRTVDVMRVADSSILGTLIVKESDDQSMLGQKINITKEHFELGRSAENDVIFAKDKPVSRQHAIIEKRGARLFIKEVVTGTTYGTFVNDTRIGPDFVALNAGDNIRLGNRATITFEPSSSLAASGAEDMTIDDLDLSGLDGKTTEVRRDDK